MTDCIFCKIINKELPSETVLETDKILAIVPLNQVSKGHLLILPKQHFENIFDITEELLQSIAFASQELSKRAKTEYQATGINLLHASGKDAQQSVFHFHLHLVPRYPDDGLDLWIREGL